jgi:iron complex transport system substrate-binding protein
MNFKSVQHNDTKYKLAPIQLLIVLLLLASSCNSSTTKQHTATTTNNRFEYAHNIVSQHGSNQVVVYLNPQHSDSVTYILSAERPEKVYDAESKTFYIQTPIRQVALTSTTDIAPIAELHETQSLLAVCEVFRFCNPEVHALHAAGKIADIGSELHENVERIIAIQPKVLIKTLYSTTINSNDALYLQADIPIIYNNNWQEANPLGRTEWIKFFGMLYNKEHEADSIFTAIRNSYNEQKARYTNTVKRPRVLAGELVQDIWYAPGGNSYIAQFIADAGGEYIFANNSEQGSIPLNFEHIFQQSQSVDIWFGSRFNTFDELFAENNLYTLLPITKTRQCYNYNKTQCGECNDYFETSTLHPDYVLADVIQILHGDSTAQQNCRFFQQISSN